MKNLAIYFHVSLPCLLILMLIPCIKAQPSNPLPLERELLTNIPDIRRVDILNDLSNYYLVKSEYKKAKAYAEDALALASRQGYEKGIAYADMWLASLGIWDPDASESTIKAIMPRLHLSLQLFTELNDILGSGFTYRNIGSHFSNTEKHDSAYYYFLLAQNCFELQKAIGHPAIDTINCKILMNLTYTCKRLKDYTSAGNYANQLVQLSGDVGYEPGLAYGYLYLGDLDMFEKKSTELGLREKALFYFNKITKAYPINSRDLNNIAWLYRRLSDMYLTIYKNYTAAMPYCEALLKICKTFPNDKFIEWVLNTGHALYALEKYSDGIRYMLAALEESDRIQNKDLMANCYFQMADLYRKSNSLEMAYGDYQKAYDLFKQTGDQRMLAWSLNLMSDINYKLGRNEVALNQLRTVRDLAIEVKDTVLISHALFNLFSIAHYDVDSIEMRTFLEASVQIQIRKNWWNLIASEYFYLAEFYLLHGNFDLAESNYLLGLAIAKDQNMLTDMQYAYQWLARTSRLNGQFEKSLDYLDKYNELRDTIYNETQQKLLAELEAKYELDKYEIEISRLEKERKIGELELTLSQEKIKGFSFANLLKSEKINLLENEKNLKECELEQNAIVLEAKEAESRHKQDQLDLLFKESEIQKLMIRKQNQMKRFAMVTAGLVSLLCMFVYNNYVTRQQLKLQKLRNKIASDLHDDIGSTLSSISIFSEMARQQSKEVIPALETIGMNSREMLDAMADIVWTINPENDQFEKIILRMRSFAYQLLGAKKIDFQFAVDEKVNALKLSMDVRKNLYLIFKEATNNMVKYADASQARFSLREQNNELTFMVKDNGKGFDPSTSSDGNGLKNMKRRADEIGGMLWIESRRNEGTTITFKIAV